MQDGDAYLAGRDAQALRRVAHNLTSVLLTLQEPAVSAWARELEGALLRADWPAAECAWRALRAGLHGMTTP